MDGVDGARVLVEPEMEIDIGIWNDGNVMFVVLPIGTVAALTVQVQRSTL